MNFKRMQPDLNREEFLHRLRHECDLHFDHDITEAVIAEVDAHLTESIQARLELGDTRESAETNAVRSFHEPKRFVRSMGHVHQDEATHDFPMFAIGVALLCWMAFYIEISAKHLTWLVAPLGVILLGVSIAIRSAQIGSPRFGTMKRLAFAAVLVIGLVAPFRTVNLWAYGGMGSMPIGMAKEMVANPDGFIRESLDAGNWATSYIGEFAEPTRYDTEPATRALSASLPERYWSNMPQTVPSLTFCLGLILISHLMPVALKKRNRRRQTCRRRMSA